MFWTRLRNPMILPYWKGSYRRIAATAWLGYCSIYIWHFHTRSPQTKDQNLPARSWEVSINCTKLAVNLQASKATMLLELLSNIMHSCAISFQEREQLNSSFAPGSHYLLPLNRSLKPSGHLVSCWSYLYMSPCQKFQSTWAAVRSCEQKESQEDARKEMSIRTSKLCWPFVSSNNSIHCR